MSVSNPQEACIEVKNLSKKFARSLRRSLIYGAMDIGRELGGRSSLNQALRPSEFWALKNVNFEVVRGRSLGIVGPNGSGKTTLLRLIAGILKPTEGEVRVRGTLAPLLALGAGFKPVLSGRENVYLNMALLGLPHETITERFTQVVDFAELWDAIEAPVGTYSSGMLARLGFSCAVHTDPTILIIDEILSVGDARFRSKCRNRINELRRQGTTFLVVSHSPISILTMADDCLFLSGGEVRGRGTPEEILRQYERESVQLDRDLQHTARETSPIGGDPRVEIESIILRSESGEGDGYWVSSRPGSLHLRLRTRVPLNEVSVNIIIAVRSAGADNVVFIQSCKDVGWWRLSEGTATITLLLPIVTLGPGGYTMKVNVATSALFDIEAMVEGFRFTVIDPGHLSQNKVFQPRTWTWEGLEKTGAPQSTGANPLPDFDEV